MGEMNDFVKYTIYCYLILYEFGELSDVKLEETVAYENNNKASLLVTTNAFSPTNLAPQ